MSSAIEAHQRWFQEVLSPKIAQIREWSASLVPLASLQLTPFFKDLLLDLEMVSLDNFTVELFIDEILQGVRTYENAELTHNRERIKPLAMMALLPNKFDRALFKEYWTDYRPFMKRHPELKDESLIQAFKLQINLKKLADYIEENTSSAPAVL